MTNTGALRPTPRNKLSDQERQAVLDVCHSEEFVSLPPSQIVPRLADQGRYLASKSSFYRVLRAEGQQHHRGRARSPVPRKPPASYRATGPCQVWTWDITWLPGPIAGMSSISTSSWTSSAARSLAGSLWPRKRGVRVHRRAPRRLARKLPHEPARAPCRHRQPDEGRDLEGDTGASWRHGLLQPPAGQ